MKISILVNKNSWILPYAKQLLSLLRTKGHNVRLIGEHEKVVAGEALIILSYERIVPEKILKKNRHNFVVHESALPKGKGWSPLTWQILEGKKQIPITVFEAAAAVDSGEIYLQDKMEFEGDELINELRRVQGAATIRLIIALIKKYDRLKGRKQKGAESFYPRRLPGDSEIDINKPLKAQFNKLRVVDNERYPAFFNYLGRKYLIKISKAGKNGKN